MNDVYFSYEHDTLVDRSHEVIKVIIMKGSTIYNNGSLGKAHNSLLPQINAVG